MSLDPEALLGVKSAVLKVALAGAITGIILRRQYKWGEALAGFTAGFCSAAFIAPGLCTWAGIVHEEIRGGIIFSVGVLGIALLEALIRVAPDLIRNQMQKYTGTPASTDKPKTGDGA